jgi:hypothetical protein
MRPLVIDTITQAAEGALREAITHADRPRERLAELAREFSLAFQTACEAARQGDVENIGVLAEAFRIACERIWTEFGGDAAQMPEIEVMLERRRQLVAELAKQFQH